MVSETYLRHMEGNEWPGREVREKEQQQQQQHSPPQCDVLPASTHQQQTAPQKNIINRILLTCIHRENHLFIIVPSSG